MNSAKIIQVIQTESSRGAGSADDPCRPLVEWWLPDGTKLAEVDRWLAEQSFRLEALLRAERARTAQLESRVQELLNRNLALDIAARAAEHGKKAGRKR